MTLKDKSMYVEYIGLFFKENVVGYIISQEPYKNLNEHIHIAVWLNKRISVYT